MRKLSSRGYGSSIAISVKTRPGRGVITTMRLDRKTDSNTEWVTNTTVPADFAPEPEQIVVELEAGDLVERGERLVHQKQASGRVTSARAMETRIFMPPDNSRG